MKQFQTQQKLEMKSSERQIPGDGQCPIPALVWCTLPDGSNEDSATNGKMATTIQACPREQEPVGDGRCISSGRHRAAP